MSFVSQVGLRCRRGSIPFVKFRKTATGAGGRLSTAVGLRRTKIDIEIDEDEKKIRFIERVDGVSVTEMGAFACSMHVLNLVGQERIFLTLESDGYWYGSYA